VILSPEGRGTSNSKLFRVQVDHAFCSGQMEFGPTLSYLRRTRIRSADYFFPMSPPSEKISAGGQVKYSFTDAFALNGKLVTFLEHRGSAADKVFQGNSCSPGRQRRRCYRGWNAVITGTYSF